MFVCFVLCPGNNFCLVRFPVKTGLSPSFAFPLMCCCRTIQMFAPSKFSLWQEFRSLVMTLLLLLPLCIALRPPVCSLLGDVRKCSLAWEGETCPTLPRCPGYLSPDSSAATLEGHRHPPVSCLETLSRQPSFCGD